MDSAGPPQCVFFPDGTTDGVKCAGEIQGYWADDGQGDVALVWFCDAHTAGRDDLTPDNS